MRILEQNQLNEIIEVLGDGAVVAVPTETVFGLAVKFDDEVAIDKLIKIKERGFDSDKVFTLMLPDTNQIKQYTVLDESAEKIIEKYFPGELTVVLRKNLEFANPYFDNFQKIGIRIPDHKFMLELLQKAGPLIVTSANKKGLTPILDGKTIEQELPEVDVVVSGEADGSEPSTVVDLTGGGVPKILRQGKVVL